MLKKILKITVASLLSFSAFAQIPSNGLVAHYPFDGNTNDESGNGHNLTAYGSVSYTTDNFSNSNAAVSIATGNYLFNSDTDIMPTGSYSVAYWVKVPTLTATYPTVLEMNEGIYCRYFKTTGKAQLGGYFNSTQNYSHDFGGMVNNQWNHFVITVDVSTGISKTYLNGIQTATNKTGITYNSPIVQNTGLIIGGGTNSGVINPIKYLAGQVDNVLIYNRALSSVEVGNIYVDNSVVSAPSLSIYNPAYQINASSALIIWDINANNALTTVKTQLAKDVNFTIGFQEFTSTSGDVNGNTVTNQNFRYTNLSPSTTYYARVVGTNSAGTGLSGVLSFTTSEALAPVISNLTTVTTISSITANYTLNTNNDFVLKSLQCAADSLFTTNVLESNVEQFSGNQISSSSISTGLSPDTKYYCRIRIQHPVNPVYSAVKSITTQGLDIPEILGINAAVNSLTSIKVSTTIKAKESYASSLTQISINQNFNPIFIQQYVTTIGANSTGTSIGIFSGLISGQTYFYRTISGSSSGVGSDTSDIKSITTPSNVPFSPVTIAEFDFDNSYFNQSNDMEFVANAKTSFSMDRNGNANGALSLVDTNIVVEIPNMPNLGWDRTISFWVKFNAYNVNGSNNLLEVGNSELYLNYYSGASFSNLYVGHNNNIFQTVESPNSKNELGEWNHLVLVIKNGQGQVYKNDTLIASGKLDLSTTSKSLVLGGNSYFPFSASYDDLKIYNYAISPTEVHNLYTNNVITGLVKNESNNLSIYPNPATSVINSQDFVEVLDLLGNKVAEGKGEIQISHLNKGIYLVKSETGSTKIVVE